MSKAIRATMEVASANNAALEAVCNVLKQSGRGFASLAAVGAAVRKELENGGAPDLAYEYVAEELGVKV